MGKHIKYSFFVATTFCLGLSYAASPVNAAVVSTDNGNADSFAHIENLDRNIEEAGKEITSLQMDVKLKNLRQQAKKIGLDFSVVRIYGIGDDLRATLQFSNNNVADVRKGDVVEERYKVTSITPGRVAVYDTKDKKAVTTPFI